MSSDSEIEDFYDAEDVTPARSARPSTADAPAEESFVQGNTALSELEIEERKLLNARQEAEERRRQEDEKLQRQLEELDRKKQEEHEKLEAAHRAEENERRRRRLDEMRQIMEGSGTPNRPPPKPPRTYLYTDPHSTSSLPGAAAASAPEATKDSSEESGEENEDDDPPTPTPQSVNAEEELLENTIDRNLQANQEYEKVQHKVIPQLILTGDNEAVGSAGEPQAMVMRVEQEPDIIQSTKASSLDRMGKVPPPRPVAPPRKKKRKAPLPPGQQGEGGDDSAQEDSLSGLELETPTSTAYSLTQELEASLNSSSSSSLPRGAELELDVGGRTTPPSVVVKEESLDIRSATKGDRLVTAHEHSSAKAEMTSLEHIHQAEAEAATEQEESTEDKDTSCQGASGEEKLAEMFTVKLGLRTPKDGSEEGVEEVREIPLSMLRPRSNSGSRLLTDEEILESVMVLNLDTGEKIPLNKAEEKLPRCINPLSLHIMRRTKEYSSDSSLHKNIHGSDEESEKSGDTAVSSKTLKTIKVATNKKRRKFKRLIGKTVHKIKSAAGEVFHGEASESDDDDSLDERRMIKVRASNSHKGPYDFDLLVPVQDLVGQHNGAVWTMEFSHCGRLLATGGQDNLLRVWVLKDAYAYFDDMRQKYSEATKAPSPAPSQDSLNSHTEATSDSSSLNCEGAVGGEDLEDAEHAPFMRKPFCVYKGHAADLLDISWSKNYFILSSSMDKTVRLWHISRKECLCCFQHIDFVTAIAFHPKDDRYFLSGSLDGKLRLWNIPDKKVALWNEVSGQTKLITAANFCQNGRMAVVGTYDGRCIFYTTEQLKYNTQINVKSTRGKNKRGRKITGVEPLPGENKMLVTSNDSRIRLYDLRDQTLTCKYRGCANNSSQIKANFSHDGKYIVCGSEDHYVYIWKTQHEFYKFSSARRDRNDYWEGIKAHNAVVTSAIFAPHPRLIIKPQFQYLDSEDQDTPAVRGEVLVSADYSGAIKIFINKFKPGSG